MIRVVGSLVVMMSRIAARAVAEDLQRGAAILDLQTSRLTRPRYLHQAVSQRREKTGAVSQQQQEMQFSSSVTQRASPPDMVDNSNNQAPILTQSPSLGKEFSPWEAKTGPAGVQTYANLQTSKPSTSAFS